MEPQNLNPLRLLTPPELQVALDLDADVDSIAKIAEKAYSAGAKIIEAGTPAVKRHGVDALIPALRAAAPGAVIVADLKTMDVGDLEARIAFRAGADVVSVLGIGNEEKIAEAMDETQRWERAILVDLIDCPNPPDAIAKLKKLLEPGLSRVIFCLHVGISLQRKGLTMADQLEVVKKAKRSASPSLLAVAGGIREDTAGDLVRAGADICIVGGAIYKSSEPGEAVRRILQQMRGK